MLLEGGRKKGSSRGRGKSSSKGRGKSSSKKSSSKSRGKKSQNRSTSRKRSRSTAVKKSYTIIDFNTGDELGGRYLGTSPMDAARKVKIWRLGLKENAPKAVVVLRQTTPGPFHNKLFAYTIYRKKVPSTPAFFALTGQKNYYQKLLEAMAVPSRLLDLYSTKEVEFSPDTPPRGTGFRAYRGTNDDVEFD